MLFFHQVVPKLHLRPPTLRPTRPRSRPARRAHAHAFPTLWPGSELLVVVGLLPGFRIDWTPENFIQKYGSQACLVIECETEVNSRATVEEFFRDFKRYGYWRARRRHQVRRWVGQGRARGGRVEVLKLKDWPPSTDVMSGSDFGRAVPVSG
ncbi:hypothetical protein H0H92_012855, partial [Tricholoma furcatifolium]